MSRVTDYLSKSKLFLLSLPFPKNLSIFLIIDRNYTIFFLTWLMWYLAPSSDRKKNLVEVLFLYILGKYPYLRLKL